MSVNHANLASGPANVIPRAELVQPIVLAQRDGISSSINATLTEWAERVLEVQATFPQCYDPTRIAFENEEKSEKHPYECTASLAYAEKVNSCVDPEGGDDDAITPEMVECLCNGIAKEPIEDLDNCVDAVCTKDSDGFDADSTDEDVEKAREEAKRLNQRLSIRSSGMCRYAIASYSKAQNNGEKPNSILKVGGLGLSYNVTILSPGVVVKKKYYPYQADLRRQFDMTPYPDSDDSSESTTKPTNTKADGAGSVKSVSLKSLLVLGGHTLSFGFAV